MGKNPFFNDLKEKNSRLLYTVTNCLLLEHYEKDQNLFFENTDIEKYYIVLKGKVTLYKRKIKRKEMTLNDFINYLESVYNLEYEKIYSFFRKDPLIRSKQNIKTIGDFI